MNLYYKGADGLLHCIKSSSDNVEEAIGDVSELLHHEREAYVKPILAVITGGK